MENGDWLAPSSFGVMKRRKEAPTEEKRRFETPRDSERKDDDRERTTAEAKAGSAAEANSAAEAKAKANSSPTSAKMAPRWSEAAAATKLDPLR